MFTQDDVVIIVLAMVVCWLVANLLNDKEE